MSLIDSSTLSNQNISSALNTHTYTASGVRKISIRLFADQVAGNGDYVAYVTIQRGGSGSAYRAIPTTSAAAASGVTSIAFPSIEFWVSNGDVVKVYLTGLAGDTTTPDIITEIWDGQDTITSKLDTIDDFLDTEIAAIKAKTDNLPSDPADASDIASSFSSLNTKVDTIDDFLDTEIAAIKAKTDNLPSDPADASDIATSFTTVNSKLDTIDDFLDTEVAAIKAKTDNLPSDPADASDVASSFGTVNTNLATIATYIDTEVAAIKAKTDNLPASPAATGDIPTANENADAILDRSAGVETGLTVRQAMRLIASALFGKLSGAATTTVAIRNIGDSKNRITATVDADGNRSAVTLDAS